MEREAAGSRIILVTDGKETTEPYVREVIPSLIRDGIVVDAILLTSKASDVLISLAAETGMKAYVFV